MVLILKIEDKVIREVKQNTLCIFWRAMLGLNRELSSRHFPLLVFSMGFPLVNFRVVEVIKKL